MKKSWWLAIWACAAFAYGDESTTVKLEPTPVEMPRHIGPMRLTGEPYHYEPAALGVSYQYLGSGLSLTAYVYDAGIADIPDGGDTIPACYLFEEAKQEINAAGYSDVRLISEQLVRLDPPADSPLAREAVFEYSRSGHPTISYLWITGIAKNFVKLRFSLDPELRDESADARRAVLTTLGEAIKPHLAHIDPGAGKSGASLNIQGGSGDDMAAGLMYSVLLTSAVDKVPQAGPVCGGEYVPPFQTELSVFSTLISMEKEGASSTLGKRLTEIDKAGFLDEFVWVERHREEWGKDVPEGLTLSEYQAWKRKNLKHFKPPKFGGVVVNHPRPMAIEAPDSP